MSAKRKKKVHPSNPWKPQASPTLGDNGWWQRAFWDRYPWPLLLHLMLHLLSC